MSNIAEYALIFQTTISDDWVEKRISAVADIKRWMSTWSNADAINNVSAIAAALSANQTLPVEMSTIVENFIRAHAKSFVRSENQGETEITVLTAASAEDLILERSSDGGAQIADVIAAALWSSLGAQQPHDVQKIEKLRQNLLNVSCSRVLDIAERSRQRRPIPGVGPVNISQESSAGQKVNLAFARAVEPMVNAMRDNAALDREELNFLWWLISERSDILNEPLSCFDNAVRAVVTGLDAAMKLRKLPADAHRNIILRNISASDPLNLKEILDGVGIYRQKLAESFGGKVSDAPAVFPLLIAITSGDEKGILSEVKLSPSEWGQRALLEGAIHHMYVHTNGGL